MLFRALNALRQFAISTLVGVQLELNIGTLSVVGRVGVSGDSQVGPEVFYGFHFRISGNALSNFNILHLFADSLYASIIIYLFSKKQRKTV
jgi:hypothetical protein